MSFWRTTLYLGIGGFLGANARYWLSIWAARLAGAPYPEAGTLFVNVTGSLLLGVVVGWVGRYGTLPMAVRLLFGTGFLGAYTTFSTYATELATFTTTADWRRAVLYTVITNAACLLAALAGIWTSQRV